MLPVPETLFQFDVQDDKRLVSDAIGEKQESHTNSLQSKKQMLHRNL